MIQTLKKYRFWIFAAYRKALEKFAANRPYFKPL